MVETRSQQQGAHLKKPGAYNTDAYYQAKDEGFGDVGVGQEPDSGAGPLNQEDPEYVATQKDLQEADRARRAEDQREMTAEEEKTAREELAELPDRPDMRAHVQNPNDEPVPIAGKDAEGREGVDAQEAADVPEETITTGP